jgi:hypothetical protein
MDSLNVVVDSLTFGNGSQMTIFPSDLLVNVVATNTGTIIAGGGTVGIQNIGGEIGGYFAPLPGAAMNNSSGQLIAAGGKNLRGIDVGGVDGGIIGLYNAVNNSSGSITADGGTLGYGTTNVGGLVGGEVNLSGATISNPSGVISALGGNLSIGTSGSGGQIGGEVNFSGATLNNAGGQVVAAAGTYNGTAFGGAVGGAVNFTNTTINGGSFIASGGTINFNAGSTVNGASISVSEAGAINASGATWNNVTLAVATKATVQNRGSLLVSGLTSLASGASISFPKATLTGTGTISGSISNPQGSLTPGNPFGQLDISNSYIQGPAGNLNIQIGGRPAGGNFADLLVGTTASLAGTLDVNFPTGFTPTLGDTYTILTAANLTGTFSTVNSSFPFQINYSTTGVSLTAIPEPASLALFCFSFGLLARPRRRQ